MSRTIVIVLAAVCLATVVLPPASPVSTEPVALEGEQDGGVRCIMIDPSQMPPVYWYTCG